MIAHIATALQPIGAKIETVQERIFAAKTEISVRSLGKNINVRVNPETRNRCSVIFKSICSASTTAFDWDKTNKHLWII